MNGYRIAPKKHNNIQNALSGIGGLHSGGRWHFIGVPIVYLASSRSLAMLERLVNDSTDILSKQLSVTTIHISDEIKIKRLVASELPIGWDEHPYISHTQKFGTEWLSSMDAAVLQVPSSLCQEEYNYIINPMHEDASKIKCIDCKDFFYAKRLSSKL